jgi:DNA-binding FrmR family transcriptional regulator
LRAVPGYTKDKQKILTRFKRIEGQVRGVQKMVEEDRYCIDVLTQVNATRAALESVALLRLRRSHTALRDRSDQVGRRREQGARAQ